MYSNSGDSNKPPPATQRARVGQASRPVSRCVWDRRPRLSVAARPEGGAARASRACERGEVGPFGCLHRTVGRPRRDKRRSRLVRPLLLKDDRPGCAYRRREAEDLRERSAHSAACTALWADLAAINDDRGSCGPSFSKTIVQGARIGAVRPKISARGPLNPAAGPPPRPRDRPAPAASRSPRSPTCWCARRIPSAGGI